MTAWWTLAAAVALLWPSKIAGPLDGVPLDGALEAILIGVALPSLWWIDRAAFRSPLARGVIVALLAWKAGTGVALQQQGLCAASFARQPLDGTTQTMTVQEPSGALRSWDMRADWRDPVPRCTAILTRPLPDLFAFPAWFLNITDQLLGARDLTMHVRGWITTGDTHVLNIEIDRDVRLSGTVSGAAYTGTPLPLPAGTHPIDLSLALSGEAWRFEPRLDGESLWTAALVTAGEPALIDRALAPWAWLVAPALVLALVAAMSAGLVKALSSEPWLAGWTVAATIGAVLIALSPFAALHRTAGLIGLGALAMPVGRPMRNLRGAFLAVGLPWLAFFVAWSFDRIGRFSVYSYDDWLAYQVAGYRIFMNGFWIEGGTLAFDYQPLYRWVTGVFHLVFGDSSVGEVYWDAACLLMGALLAFYLVRARAGFRWGLVAAVATLATFTLGTPWYFLGRGLSEIAAAGFAFVTMFFLLRGRHGRRAWILAAALSAVLMFYSRLNHMLWVAFLPAFLLPLGTGSAWRDVIGRFARVRVPSIALYASVFVGGVLLFMTRTWYFTGVFALFHGTSLRHNDTGLRPWTLFDGEVWAKVAHSLWSFVWMNEPPRPDPRALVMVAGVLVGIAALLQTPMARRVPGGLVIAAAGAAVGAFFAHAHGYPGRFSIHAVPLASALTMIAAAKVMAR